MIESIGEILGRVIVLIQLSAIMIISILALIVLLYVLTKILYHLLRNEKSLNDNAETKPQFLKTKIVLVVLGLIYCLIILSGIIFFIVQPSWFHPPAWLRIISIIIFVPYLACVFGFLGLGNIARSGFTPWKDFKLLFKKA